MKNEKLRQLTQQAVQQRLVKPDTTVVWKPEKQIVLQKHSKYVFD